VEEGCPTGAVPFRSCRSCPSPCFPCLEDVCMVSLGKLLAERCMLLLSLEKLPCGEGDVLLWLERGCQLCKLLFSSFCCRPTFASFERGDTQGETRGRGAAHQLCKLLFSSFCELLSSSFCCRFGASRVLHCCGEKSVQVKTKCCLALGGNRSSFLRIKPLIRLANVIACYFLPMTR